MIININNGGSVEAVKEKNLSGFHLKGRAQVYPAAGYNP